MGISFIEFSLIGDALEITFPQVQGYRTELPETKLTATCTADSELKLTPDLSGQW
ncbi:hypothetical protein [Synechococcus sp. PCC 6312]|uniref:hypothetical protein n=1 Tax=Synechococcus sp. (strain ATCC 27167 / PCC 6312) TaxID=195253 RepID=UPI0002D80A85|nr:hypothetical protein [Synechococcus sp. PCC 6312]